MREQIIIKSRDGQIIKDIDGSLASASGLKWATDWVKGYGPASFNVSRDIAERWAVSMAQELLVMDGNTIVYQGDLGPLTRQLQGLNEKVSIKAVGRYGDLAQFRIRKRWADNAPFTRSVWNKRNNEQKKFQAEKREGDLTVTFPAGEGADDTQQTWRYEERYTMPAGETVKRVTFSYRQTARPQKFIGIYNDSGTLIWSREDDAIPDTNATASVDFVVDTQSIIFKIGSSVTGHFDADDKIIISDMVVYSEIPPITAGSIIQNILTMAGGRISADFGQWVDPALSLIPFMSLNDSYATADELIQQALKYGDSSQRLYAFGVWDEFGTTDALPLSKLYYRDLTTPKWIANLDELTNFQDAESDAGLHNWVIVEYEDSNGITQFRTPEDNALLLDQDSIDRWGRRDSPPLRIGAGDATLADALGQRYLAYHKDPLRQASFSKRGHIRTAQGEWRPVNRVHGGEALKVLDYNGGQVYWITHTDYDAETTELRIEPDLPPDDLEIQMQQQEDLGA